MTSTKVSEASTADAATDPGRREALKRFGRYAAVAPTTILLLSPRSGRADHKPWHSPPNPGGASGKDGGYD